MAAVLRQQLAPDVVLETRLFDDGLVRHVAIVTTPGSSTRDLHRAVERARAALKDCPEMVEHVELDVNPEAIEHMIRAEDRRQHRAAKRLRLVQ